ncbi:MAG: LysE family translocator [Herminiimonas sp.]|nr:LysE family translocator [Herminiimonas sp.]
MTTASLLLFAVTEAALSLSPGPAVMLVVACGIAHGWRKSLYATLGILSANALYFVLSATGIGSLIAASHDLFTVIRWIGAGYLVYLGLMAIFGKPSPLTIASLEGRPSGGMAIFRSAVLLQMANPKSLLMFVAILPQFVDPAAPVGFQMLILAALSIVPELCILLGYGLLASSARQWATQPRYARMTDRCAGSLVVLAGILVASVNR